MPTDHTNTSPDKSPHHAAYKMSTDPDSSEAMLIIQQKAFVNRGYKQQAEEAKIIKSNYSKPFFSTKMKTLKSKRHLSRDLTIVEDLLDSKKLVG